MTPAQVQDAILARLRAAAIDALHDHPDATRLTLLWALADLEGEVDDMFQNEKEATE